MNFLLFKPFFKAVRGKSLTFALVFATALLGFSIASFLRRTLSDVGFWLPVVWILPIIAIGFLAKKEDKIPLRAEFKRLLCYILVGGSIFCSVVIWRYRVHLDEKYPELKEEREVPRRTGPRGK